MVLQIKLLCYAIEHFVLYPRQIRFETILVDEGLRSQNVPNKMASLEFWVGPARYLILAEPMPFQLKSWVIYVKDDLQ